MALIHFHENLKNLWTIDEKLSENEISSKLVSLILDSLFNEEKEYNLWIDCTNICIDLKNKYPVFATLFKNKQERKEFFKKLRFTLNKMKYQK